MSFSKVIVKKWPRWKRLSVFRRCDRRASCHHTFIIWFHHLSVERESQGGQQGSDETAHRRLLEPRDAWKRFTKGEQGSVSLLSMTQLRVECKGSGCWNVNPLARFLPVESPPRLCFIACKNYYILSSINQRCLLSTWLKMYFIFVRRERDEREWRSQRCGVGTCLFRFSRKKTKKNHNEGLFGLQWPYFV